jgi:hypothetical protein
MNLVVTKIRSYTVSVRRCRTVIWLRVIMRIVSGSGFIILVWDSRLRLSGHGIVENVKQRWRDRNSANQRRRKSLNRTCQYVRFIQSWLGYKVLEGICMGILYLRLYITNLMSKDLQGAFILLTQHHLNSIFSNHMIQFSLQVLTHDSKISAFRPGMAAQSNESSSGFVSEDFVMG